MCVDGLLVAKSQGILKVPAEFAFSKMTTEPKYLWDPDIIDVKIVEEYQENIQIPMRKNRNMFLMILKRYDHSNSVTFSQCRSPIVQGRMLEYCTFNSVYMNSANRLFAVAYRSIKHDQVKFSGGSIVVDLLPSGFVIDVPADIPQDYCQLTYIFQMEKRTWAQEGVILSPDLSAQLEEFTKVLLKGDSEGKKR